MLRLLIFLKMQIKIVRESDFREGERNVHFEFQKIIYRNLNRSGYKDQKGKYHNVTSFHILKFDDAEIILLEDYPCENKQQLYAKEGSLDRTFSLC